MGIETLHRAADAAGYAMAAPDDEIVSTAEQIRKMEALAHVAAKSEQHKNAAIEAVSVATNWLRVRLPLAGGRAPA